MNTAEQKRTPGRPIVTTSVRQQKMAEAAARIEPLKKGRPVNPLSKRQQEATQKQTIIEAGGIIKVGRPKMAKEDVAPTISAEIQVN